MTTVKITCDTGKTWITGINANPDKAQRYFMGADYVDEDERGRETHNFVVDVQPIGSKS